MERLTLAKTCFVIGKMFVLFFFQKKGLSRAPPPRVSQRGVDKAMYVRVLDTSDPELADRTVERLLPVVDEPVATIYCVAVAPAEETAKVKCQTKHHDPDGSCDELAPMGRVIRTSMGLANFWP